MIIISQDKITYINYDIMRYVNIKPYGTHKKIYKMFTGNFNNYKVELGTYNTMERAREVLRELECYANLKTNKKYYEMPVE